MAVKKKMDCEIQISCVEKCEIDLSAEEILKKFNFETKYKIKNVRLVKNSDEKNLKMILEYENQEIKIENKNLEEYFKKNG